MITTNLEAVRVAVAAKRARKCSQAVAWYLLVLRSSDIRYGWSHEIIPGHGMLECKQSSDYFYCDFDCFADNKDLCLQLQTLPPGRIQPVFKELQAPGSFAGI